MIIRDDGKGLPESFDIKTATSTGSQIIYALAGQLHAELHVSSENGAIFRIVLDVPVKD